MPNGHGGYPFMGSPVLLALLFVVAQAWRLPVPSTAHSVRLIILIVLSVAIGWRVAYHLHMRDAHEYGGALIGAEERKAAERRYLPRAVLYALISGAIGIGILMWRGLL